MRLSFPHFTRLAFKQEIVLGPVRAGEQGGRKMGRRLHREGTSECLPERVHPQHLARNDVLQPRKHLRTPAARTAAASVSHRASTAVLHAAVPPYDSSSVGLASWAGRVGRCVRDAGSTWSSECACEVAVDWAAGTGEAALRQLTAASWSIAAALGWADVGVGSTPSDGVCAGVTQGRAGQGTHSESWSEYSLFIHLMSLGATSQMGSIVASK